MTLERDRLFAIEEACGDLAWASYFFSRGLVTDPVLIRTTDTGEPILTRDQVEEAHQACRQEDPQRMLAALKPLAKIAPLFRDGRVQVLGHVGSEPILAMDDRKQAPLILACEVITAEKLCKSA